MRADAATLMRDGIILASTVRDLPEDGTISTIWVAAAADPLMTELSCSRRPT